MKALILYRPESEHSRKVDEFLHLFNKVYPHKKLELISLDTREGSATASIYDVVQHPAVLAVRDDGAVLRVWQGEHLPLIDEVAGYI